MVFSHKQLSENSFFLYPGLTVIGPYEMFYKKLTYRLFIACAVRHIKPSAALRPRGFSQKYDLFM